jgi:hypothetical protein
MVPNIIPSQNDLHTIYVMGYKYNNRITKDYANDVGNMLTCYMIMEAKHSGGSES